MIMALLEVVWVVLGDLRFWKHARKVRQRIFPSPSGLCVAVGNAGAGLVGVFQGLWKVGG